MIISTIKTADCTPQTIVIGRRATYETLQVVFDLSYLAETYGSGTSVLVVKRSQDETAYPATITQEGNTLTWTISETDTYYVGAGECELMWYVNNGLAKTIIYPVVVMRDILQTAEEPPDAYENWIEHLTELGAETQQHALDAAQSATESETAQGKAEDAQSSAENAQEAAEEAARKAEESSVHAPIIVNGYWYAWNATTETYQNTGVKAEGHDGTDGFSPVITVTDITGGHRVTITDADGTQTVDVMNGTDGDDGFSPTVTITEITGGHRVTITDKTHPSGQIFDVMDGVIQSVNGKSAASITLDSGDIEFDDSETYAAGSIGAEVSNQKNAISQKAPVIINSASGDVASFADGADDMPIKKLVGTIEPVQDLHGYDHPWPGGGNVNKLPAPADGTYTQNGITVTVKNGVYTFSGVSTANQYITFPALPSSANLSPSTNKIAFLNNFVDANVTFDFLRGDERIHYWGMTVTNRVATGWTDSGNENVDTIRIYCQTGFDGNGKTISTMLMSLSESDPTAFSPYANECPISGHTGCNVTRTGVNLFGGEAFADTIMEKVPRATIDTVNKTVTFVASNIQSKILFNKFKPNMRYTIFLRNTGASNMSVVYTDGTSIGLTVNGLTVTSASKSVARIIGEWQTGNTTVYYEDFGVFEGVLTADDFAPYTGTTIPITFPTTIYGGSDEVIGGALVSDLALATFNGASSESWVDDVSGGYHRFRIQINDSIVTGGVAKIPACNIVKYANGSNVEWSAFVFIRYYYVVPSQDITTVAAWKEFLANTPLQIAYKLDTPTEYTLTPQELTTLYGQNNVWTDVGSVSVDYPADTKLYIDNKITTAIANALNA